MRKFGKKLDFENGRIDMTFGAGGKATAQLVEELFVPAFNNEYLSRGDDQAILSSIGSETRLAVTTDSHVVSPLFFPGGDIGSLSVYGTINDLAVGGAEPLCLTAGFVIEEGFPLKSLRAIVESMRKAQGEVGCQIVAGDTKVVEKGKGDGVFINTTGVGVVRLPHLLKRPLSVANVRSGDAILLSGRIADHGVAIMSKRQNLGFETTTVSDSAPLHELALMMVRAVPEISCMRDPTRGGVSATLNEVAHSTGFSILVEEEAVPVATEARAACEILGIDPLQVANEGKLVAFCPAAQAERLLSVMREHPLGREACRIGEVLSECESMVQARAPYGGRRILQWLAGDPLPRIC